MIIDDNGIIVQIKQFSENSLIVSCFLQCHGIFRGIVKRTKECAKLVYRGNVVKARWIAKTIDQLGIYSMESLKLESEQSNLYESLIVDEYLRKLLCFDGCNIICDAHKSAIISVSLDLICALLPEKEKNNAAWIILIDFVSSMIDCHEDYRYYYAKYAKFEMEILESCGLCCASMLHVQCSRAAESHNKSIELTDVIMSMLVATMSILQENIHEHNIPVTRYMLSKALFNKLAVNDK